MNWIKGKPILSDIAVECILVTAEWRPAWGEWRIKQWFVQEFIDYDRDDTYHWGVCEDQDDDEVELDDIDCYIIIDYPERSEK